MMNLEGIYSYKPRKELDNFSCYGESSFWIETVDQNLPGLKWTCHKDFLDLNFTVKRDRLIHNGLNLHRPSLSSCVHGGFLSDIREYRST